MTKKLETIQEVLHALADGHKVKDSDFLTAVLREETLVFLDDSGNLFDAYLEDLVFPCTIVEEQEFLYEWEWWSEWSEDSYQKYSKVSKHKPDSRATKTGRKFILKDGVPVLYVEGE